MAARRIVVLGTGGTIAGVAGDTPGPAGYTAGALGIADLLANLPGLRPEQVEVEDVARIDSKDMDWATWQRLAAACSRWLEQPDVRGIVVTHGTDTLEETAWLLQRVLAPRLPIVLASAMRPATAASPDGPRNLLDAFAVAGTEGAAGVLAVSAGAIHAARDVRKVHPTRLDAFASGDAGPLGSVEDGRVRLLRSWPRQPADGRLAQRLAQASQAPRVEIVHSHAAADGRVVDLLAGDGVQGLVVATTGNGTVHAALEQALLRAIARGVRVVRSTRCLDGPIAEGPGAAIPATALTPAKARVDLLLDLLG